jgi:hypothetical protein
MARYLSKLKTEPAGQARWTPLGLREIPGDSFGLARYQLIALPPRAQSFDLSLDLPFQPTP